MRSHRITIILLGGVLAAPTAQIAHGAELPQELIDCRAIASAVARLDCYDQLVDTQAAAKPAEAVKTEAPPPAAKVVPEEPAAAVTPEEPAEEISPEALFGKNETAIRKSVQEVTGAKEIESIQAKISKLQKSAATGYVVITLDNGQVWKQIDNSRLRLSNDDDVTIRRAALGSFMLFKSGKKTMMRVKRIS